ncbi:MAG TPA: DUF4276 family protein, partial [Methanoculleus sp.]|nr:DUF4276 family protein [Methanoculleus sp.]
VHFEVLLEEESARVAMNNLLPKMIRSEDSFSIHPFSGKKDLLSKLPGRLRAYKKWIPPDYRIVVLMDRDRDDCTSLKKQMEKIAIEAGLSTKSSPPNEGHFQVLNRIAIEELEAWFFGDVEALVAAYPRVPPTLGAKERYRDPDAVVNAWEALERVLQQAGYPGPLRKIKFASEISRGMVPERNRSASFQSFYTGILACIRQS